MSNSCKLCLFFDLSVGKVKESENAGLCHFNPPVAFGSSDKWALWPSISANDWCNRFENGSF